MRTGGGALGVSQWTGSSPCYGGGGEANGLELELMAGVLGDGVQAFKATVDLVQAVGCQGLGVNIIVTSFCMMPHSYPYRSLGRMPISW